MSPDVAALAALACGAAGLIVRPLIAWVPEPETDPDHPKPTYADVAAARGVAARSVLLAALAGALIGGTLGWDWALLVLLPLVPVAVALAEIDRRTRLLPVAIVRPALGALLVLGVVASLLGPDTGALLRAVLGGAAVFAFFYALWWVHAAGMGFGDVRVSAGVGFALGYLGWPEVVVGVYAGFLVFGLLGLTRALAHRDRGLLEGRGALRPGPARRGVGRRGARRAGLASRRRVTGRARRTPRERLPPCCAGSPRGSPTDPPWSRSSRGCPPMSGSTSDDISDALARRRLGYGRGARMKFEQDEVTIIGGVRHGETQGGPVAIQVGNTEWPKWDKVMSADPVDQAELDALARNAPLTRPRPGHADLVGMQKYDFDDARPILERASRPRDRCPRRAGRVASQLPRAGRRRPDRLAT